MKNIPNLKGLSVEEAKSILDRQEVFGDNAATNPAASTTRQLDYYKSNNTRDKRIKTPGSGWWLRTATNVANDRHYLFDYVSDYGNVYGARAWVYSYGVSLAFRIGN